MTNPDELATQPQSGVTLLKTCQTCFNAKIRCVKTQESGLCDRCLRLDKTCIFKPARRSRVRQGRTATLEVRARTDSRSPSGVPTMAETENRVSTPNRVLDDHSSDPFDSGLLSYEVAGNLIEYYNTKMVTHYPFVIVPKGQSVKEMAQNRPGLCLAAFAAASHDNVQLQRSLNTLFNKLISARLLKGSFASLDVLQGLLVHVAWGHYQTRPRRYTQYLHLATSIISDLRIDQPRKPRLWSVDGGKERDSADWGIEEMRALAGAYYLSSNTSILLHKSRHFTHSSYISRCVEYISANAQVPTDTHLQYLIRLQRLTEEIDDVWNADLDDLGKQRAGETIRHVATQCETIKSSLPFPINESLPILFQFNLLELFLSQSSPGGSHYGVDKFEKPVLAQYSQNSNLIDWLSASISAAQSIIRIIIVLPSGEEAILSNISWIIIYCALSLAVRLDLTAAKTASTQFLRRFLDMSQTLRQICIRLEARSGEDVDETGDHNAFYHLALRARRLEKWYQKQSAEEQGNSNHDHGAMEHDPSLSDIAPSSVAVSDDSLDFGMSSVLFSDTLGFPMHLDIENEGMWSDFTPAG